VTEAEESLLDDWDATRAPSASSSSSSSIGIDLEAELGLDQDLDFSFGDDPSGSGSTSGIDGDTGGLDVGSLLAPQDRSNIVSFLRQRAPSSSSSGKRSDTRK
jgi:hypothetical protein